MTTTDTTFTPASTLPDFIATRLQVPVKRATALLEQYGSPATHQTGDAVVCKRAEVADWMLEVAQRENIGKAASCAQIGKTRNLPGGILCPPCRQAIECAPLYEGAKS